MDLSLEGIVTGFQYLWVLHPEVPGISWLALKVSGITTIISVGIGISTGMIVALPRFPGKKFVVSVVNTVMGLPPVVAGLFVTLFLRRNGPFGFLDILYTPTAIIIARRGTPGSSPPLRSLRPARGGAHWPSPSLSSSLCRYSSPITCLPLFYS